MSQVKHNNSDYDQLLNHRLLPYVQILALYIRINTSYQIEISSLENDKGDIYFQIDEINNKFYFTFSENFEYAVENFNSYISVDWNDMFSYENITMIPRLHNMGASESLVHACRTFLEFMSSNKNLIICP